MNKNIYESKARKRVTWDILQERALSQKVLTDIIHFHQSTVFFKPKETSSNFISSEVMAWLGEVEYTDILPDTFEEEIPLVAEPTYIEGSTRNYDLSYQMDEITLGNIMYKAFGRGEGTMSKRYGSAGGLYPVMPLLFVLRKESITSLPNPGVYMFNPFSISMYRIKTWNKRDLEQLKVAICLDDFISPFAMAYAIDLRRTVTKYRKRGYRHALIEVGLMAQSFRESLREVNKELGDLCWSGFNDNAITYLAGLNVRLAPVVLLQWFGKKR